ncbi:hypothetical protein SAMN02745866_00923 [Alteromonadaceae bacterium Bs31]|nr:hypothetical protein SAMN02745866_00923 [Alteromonadaceae bacterium Bs31]
MHRRRLAHTLGSAMKGLKLKIHAPATILDPRGVPLPDPCSSYSGATISLSEDKLPPIIGGTSVTGGQKTGTIRMGCTYMKAPYTIPGLCDVALV